ncbi:hypothetical protein, partial [Kaarinaea lacus]
MALARRRVLAMFCMALVVASAVADKNAEQQFQLGMQAYEAKDYVTAWRYIHPLAQQGNMEAQRRID